MDPDRVAAVVLAAGLGTRFGGAKVLVRLDGRPLLQHVLDRVREAGVRTVVVVLGRDASEVGASITWRDERRVVNPRPETGLSGSVRLGFAELADNDFAAVLVMLGDQPHVRSDVIGALLAAPTSDGQPFAVPRYADGDNPNPVLVRRAAWPLVAQLTGDRGLGPLLRAHPERVVDVPTAGSNPDVDTLEDLDALSRA